MVATIDWPYSHLIISISIGRLFLLLEFCCSCEAPCVAACIAMMLFELSNQMKNNWFEAWMIVFEVSWNFSQDSQQCEPFPLRFQILRPVVPFSQWWQNVFPDMKWGWIFLTLRHSLSCCCIVSKCLLPWLSERYHSLAPMYYRGAQAAIVVYDVTNQVWKWAVVVWYQLFSNVWWWLRWRVWIAWRPIEAFVWE